MNIKVLYSNVIEIILKWLNFSLNVCIFLFYEGNFKSLFLRTGGCCTQGMITAHPLLRETALWIDYTVDFYTLENHRVWRIVIYRV